MDVDATRLRGAIVLELALVRAPNIGGPVVRCASLLPGGGDFLSAWCVLDELDAASSAMARLHACGEAFFRAAQLGVAPIAFPARAECWLPICPSVDPRLRVVLHLGDVKAMAWAIHCWDATVHYVNAPRDYPPWAGQHVIEDVRFHVARWACRAMEYDASLQEVIR